MKIIILIALIIQITYCNTPISATSYLGSGFDAQKALFGLAPIFDFTYDEGLTWTSPYTKITYDVPDQMSVSPHESVQEIVNQGSYSSYHEYKQMFEEWFSFDVGINAGNYFSAGYKYNKTLGYVHDKMSESYAEIIRGHHLWTYYLATLYPSFVMTFNPMFEKSIEMFPQIIKTNADREFAYQFVQTFGTHYSYKAIFGAKLDFNAAISSYITRSYSREWCYTQYGFYFHYKLFNVSSGGFANQTDITVDKTFLKNINAQTFFLGGDPTLADLNNLTLWVKSIDQNTAPMNITLVGLWNLVKDPIKRNTMRNYIRNYIVGGTQLSESDIDLGCLGAGIDITTMEGCLANVYIPFSNRTFISNIPESEFVKFAVTFQSTFNLNAWSDTKTTSHYAFGMGTKTKEVYRYYDAYYKEHKSLSSVILQLAYYKATSPVLPLPVLNPMFTEALNKLPPYNANSKNMYYQFLQTWGIAVIDEVILGGYFEVDMWYDSSINQIYSGEQISESSEWSFAGIIGDGYGHFYDKNKIDKRFNQSISVSYEYIGGANNFIPNQYKLWAKTVKDNLQVIKYHLQPITFFITDTTKKNNIALAIKDYCQMSVNELQQYIDDLVNN
jgi:hypothetical protein